jgi:hypothetical protein
MKVEFKIQNKTVFSIYNQEGEIWRDLIQRI